MYCIYQITFDITAHNCFCALAHSFSGSFAVRFLHASWRCCRSFSGFSLSQSLFLFFFCFFHVILWILWWWDQISVWIILAVLRLLVHTKISLDYNNEWQNERLELW